MKLNKEKLIKAYKNKNVYITGITGFKGSWLALVLHELGANVSGMGLSPDCRNSIFYQAKVQEIADVTFGDITSPTISSDLMKGILSSDPDYVFHMAAQPIVSEGYKNPYDTFHTNIMGTVILHEVLRAIESDKKVSLINITTDKVYKEINRPLKEDDVMHGFDPYSLSKTCSDMITSCYRDALKSKHRISTMRAGNVIGGGDMSVNRIVPDIYTATQSGDKLEIRNPGSVRPYQHVFDAITGYLWIALLQKENEEYQGAYNIGPELTQTMTTIELVQKMSSKMNFEYEVTGESIGKESDYLALDNTKLKETGWVAFFNDNEKVLDSTSEWYNKFIQGEEMKEFTLNQIKEALDNV